MDGCVRYVDLSYESKCWLISKAWPSRMTDSKFWNLHSGEKNTVKQEKEGTFPEIVYKHTGHGTDQLNLVWGQYLTLKTAGEEA